MELIDAWISANAQHILFALAAVALVSMALSTAALVRGEALKKRYRRMMMGREGLRLEELLNHHGALIEDAIHRQKLTGTRLAGIEEKLQLTVSGLGLVRYNAFRETGSDLSFSLALLDRNLDGMVLTSLFGREESRCYGKPIKRGQSAHLLSEEEIQALNEARRQLGAGDDQVL